MTSCFSRMGSYTFCILVEVTEKYWNRYMSLSHSEQEAYPAYKGVPFALSSQIVHSVCLAYNVVTYPTCVFTIVQKIVDDYHCGIA